jgi:hypothetical protein
LLDNINIAPTTPSLYWSIQATTTTDLDFGFFAYTAPNLPINVVGSPFYTPLATLTYTPPATGSFLAECNARLVNTGPATRSSTVMLFAINGVNNPLDTQPVVVDAFDANCNIFGQTFWEFPCVAGVPQTISCVAQTTDFGVPGVGDVVCRSAALSITFVS